MSVDPPGPGEPLLEVEDLHAGYGRSEVVRGLSFTVSPGQVLALLGPNGAGKTTTLLTVAGLLPPLGGSVRFLGSPVDRRSPHRNARRGIGFVTDDRSLFPSLTVAENLRLGARRRRLPTDVLDQLPLLTPLLDRPAGLLSGGEQQMLAIARALAARPKLLLVDEMSMGLAPVALDPLAAVVRRIADESGVGIVLVEQHLVVAQSIADDVLVLRHGEVALRAPAADLADGTDLADALHTTYLG